MSRSATICIALLFKQLSVSLRRLGLTQWNLRLDLSTGRCFQRETTIRQFRIVCFWSRTHPFSASKTSEAHAPGITLSLRPSVYNSAAAARTQTALQWIHLVRTPPTTH